MTRSTKIKNICYENNFYDSKEMEKALSKLENESATVIHGIVDSNSLKPIENNSQARYLLDFFVSHTHSRTKAAKIGAEELSQEFLERIVEMGVESGELDDNHLEMVQNDEVRLEGPHLAARQFASSYGPFHFLNLNRVLLYNATGEDFITSDNPVVLDNPRFKNEVSSATIGLASRGLQIFCPLSPNVCLFMFDPEVYTVKSNSNYTTIIKKNNTIKDINKLQLINCLENCYFKNQSNGEQVDALYQSVKDKRTNEFVKSRREKMFDEQQEREREFLITEQPESKYIPNLPFTTVNPYVPYSPVRDEQLVRNIRKMKEEELEEAKEEFE